MAIVNNVEPVLFVGLGGTGKQTLMNLRRLFLDNYDGAGSRVPPEIARKYGTGRMPHTAFLCFDSDRQLTDIDGEKPDALLAAAQLNGESEFISVELDRVRMEKLYAEPHTHPEFLPWYDFSLKDFGIPAFGCGQTRPWGRAAFFQHYTIIRRRLKAAIEQLTSIETANDSQKCDVVQLTDRVNVFVVFSMAGGTGSGMFLDMAFLLRDLERETNRTLACESIILMPEAFSTDPNHKIFANSYAGLLELEHYSLGGRANQADTEGNEGFPVYWPGEYNVRSTPRRILPPAFAANWLIGSHSRGVNQTVTGTQILPDHKRDLTAMMAEWVFLRCSPDHQTFAASVNSYIRGNFIPVQMAERANADIHETNQPEPDGKIEFSRRFASFGLSKIYLPTSVIHQRVAYRLVGQLVDRWVVPPQQEIATQDIIRREVLPRICLRVQSEGGLDLEGAEALYEHIDGGSTGSTVVRQALNSFADTFDPAAAAATFGGDLARGLREQFRSFRLRFISDDGVNPANHGEYAKQIAANKRTMMKMVDEGLDESLHLSLRDSGRRFTFATTMLESCTNAFKQANEQASGDVTDRKQRSEDHAGDSDAVLSHAIGEARRLKVLTTIAKVAIDDERKAIREDLERQIAKAAAEVATHGQTVIINGTRNLTGQLAALQKSLVSLRDSAKKTERLLENRPVSILNHQLPANTDDYYKTPDGRDIDDDWLALCETAIYASEDLRMMVWRMRDALAGGGLDDALTKLAEEARLLMGHVPRNARDALGVFDRSFPKESDAQYTEALRRVVANSTAWQRLTTEGAATWGLHANVEFAYHVGLEKGRDASRIRLDNQLLGPTAPLRQSLAPVNTLELDQGNSVYFVQEMAGFPPHVLSRVADYRSRSYEPYLRGDRREGASENSALHLERDPSRFGTLVVPSVAEARARASALTLFAEALIKGALTISRDRYGAISFAYKKELGYEWRDNPIGSFDRATLLLTPGLADVEHLRKAIDRAEKKSPAGDANPQDASLPSPGTVAHWLVLTDYYRNSPARPFGYPRDQEASTPPDGWRRALDRVAKRLATDHPDAVALARTLSSTLTEWTAEPHPGSGFRVVKLA